MSDQVACAPCGVGTFGARKGSSACDECKAGKWSSDVGATQASACVPCGIGRFGMGIAAVNDSACLSCGVGTWNAALGASACTGCTAGKSSMAIGAHDDRTCGDCDAGKFSGMVAASTCAFCPAGRWSNTRRTTACRWCVIGTWSDMLGSTNETNCISCEVGTWSTLVGASSASACEPCHAGKWSRDIGMSACLPCKPGRWSTAVGATTCTRCISGKWSSIAGASGEDVCTSCLPGRWSVTTAASDVSSCEKCLPGTWSDVAAATKCVFCPAGKWNEVTGSVNSSACETCDAGRWSLVVGADTESVCTPCVPGRWSDIIGASAVSACRECAAGKWNNAVGISAMEECVSCRAGRWSNTMGADAESTCMACDVGRWSDAVAATAIGTCRACKAGRWNGAKSANAESWCVACGLGKWSGFVGATAENRCANCRSGRWSNATAASTIGTCTACAAGTYSEIVGATAASTCTDCGLGKWSETVAAGLETYCRPCVAGRWSGIAAAIAFSNCTTCQPGTWSSSVGATAVSTCLSCAVGTWSGKFGAVTDRQCISCTAGRWSRTIAASAVSDCIACKNGTWSGVVGASSASMCKECQAGRWSAAVGATHIDTCAECGRGVWSNAGAAFCTRCAAGKFSMGLGATNIEACTDCRRGTYGPKEGALDVDDCLPCAAGRFGEAKGASSLHACRPCRGGRWSGESTPKCYDCVPGRWSLELAVNCSECPVGRWSAAVAASSARTCSLCPAGSASSALGASSFVSCVACKPGSWSGAGDADCIQCASGTFQNAASASACIACASGRHSSAVGAISPASCVQCDHGTFSIEASDPCRPCPSGTHGPAKGLSACIECPGGVTPEGAVMCCPSDSDDWPLDSKVILSMPPGKSWTFVHVLPGCDHTLVDQGSIVGDEALLSDYEVVVSTLRQSSIHSCKRLRCGSRRWCGVLPPGNSQLMPGRPLKVAAYIEVFNKESHHMCMEQVTVDFAGFGCEPNTILSFLCALVAVITFTVFLGIAFEYAFRRRVTVLIETSLRIQSVLPTRSHQDSDARSPRVVTTSAGHVHKDGLSQGLSMLPVLHDLHCEVCGTLALHESELPFARFLGWGIGYHEDSTSASAEAVQLEFQIVASHGSADIMRRKLLGFSWRAGAAWASDRVSVMYQPPALVKEAGKLPGADLIDAVEALVFRCFSCCGFRSSGADVQQLRIAAARSILAQLMTRRATFIIAAQAASSLLMITVLPSLALRVMTCQNGYPIYIHAAWMCHLFTSSALGIWFTLRPAMQTQPEVIAFLSRYRLQLGIRFGAMLISITDVYQDATFPVIAGVCGFDLWWVSLWLVFLGVGVMQVGVQSLLVFKSWRKYRWAQTPEEREMHHIEAVFLALRACDNHMLVYSVKPAVEERLGGASSWKMKTVEARVAFLRFVFEDAEQSALQVIFLWFFESASVNDKIWVGCSTATSLLLSFTLTVQTLPEVRDWLWHQLLARLPFGSQWHEVRLMWLLLLVMLYRAVSIFPWFGACTPAGDYNMSTLSRLLLISGKAVPEHVVKETLLGTLVAGGVTIVATAFAALIWRRTIGLRLSMCACTHTVSTDTEGEDEDGGTSASGYDFGKRMAANRGLRLKGQEDTDTWLTSLRVIYAAVVGTLPSERLQVAAKLLAQIDSGVFRITHATGTSCSAFHKAKEEINRWLLELDGLDLPKMLDPTSAGTEAALSSRSEHTHMSSRQTVQSSLSRLRCEARRHLECGEVRARALELLADRSFRRAGLCKKARLIHDATGGRAPLRLLHWSSLEALERLPRCGEDCAGSGSEDISAALQRVLTTGGRKIGSDIASAEDEAERRIVLVYLSHTWSRKDNPDTEGAQKARGLVRFARWFMERATRHQMQCELFFWVDYCCLDVDIDVGIQALPLYVATCTEILTWQTPDFDRRCWTMVERLLAYCFCRGGLTPFAIDGTSFVEQREAVPPNDDGEDASDCYSECREAPMSLGQVSPCQDSVSDGQPPRSLVKADIKLCQVCPFDDASDGPLWQPCDVLRRPRKLHNPLDSKTCRPCVLATAREQRRRVKQLVEMALAVSALEVFADRQPVDFGLTAVVEQWIGQHRSLKTGVHHLGASAWQPFRVSGVGTRSDTASAHKWLVGETSSKPVADWRLAVERPSEAGAGIGQEFTLSSHVASSDGSIVVIDTSAEPEGLAVTFRGDAPPPSPREIDRLFAEVDVAYEEQFLAAARIAAAGSGGQGHGDVDLASTHRLEKSVVSLIAALKADLRTAETSGDEVELRNSIQRTRDVEMPDKHRAAVQLARLQLLSGIAAGDMVAIRMAMRQARQLGAQDVIQEYAEAQVVHQRLQREKLQAGVLAVIHSATIDIDAVVAAAGVARQKGWEDLLQQALHVLCVSFDEGDGEGVAHIARAHRLGCEQDIFALTAITGPALDRRIEDAACRKDVPSLLEVCMAAEAERLALVAAQAHTRVIALIEDLVESWHEGAKVAAERDLQTIVAAAERCGMNATSASAIDGIRRAEAREQAARRDAQDLLGLQRPSKLHDLLDVVELADRWAWADIKAEAIQVLSARVKRAASKRSALAVTELAEFRDIAIDKRIDPIERLAASALDTFIVEAERDRDALTLMEMAHAAEERGSSDFAGSARVALKRLVDAWKEADAREAQESLKSLWAAAQLASDDAIAELVGNAIGVTELREGERRAAARASLAAALNVIAAFDILETARCRGWADVALEALELVTQMVLRAASGDSEDSLVELARAHSIARSHHVQAVLELTSKSFEARVQQASESRDLQTLLLVVHVAGSEDCVDIAKQASAGVDMLLRAWKDEGRAKAPPYPKRLADYAVLVGASDISVEVSALADLFEALDRTMRDGDALALAALVGEATRLDCGSALQEARQALQQQIDDMKCTGDIDSLRLVCDAARRFGVNDAVAAAAEAMYLADRLAKSILARSGPELVDAVVAAERAGCSALARDGRSALMQLATLLGESAHIADERLRLQALHDAASRASLDDVVDRAVAAFGGHLPIEWGSKDGKRKSLDLLRKMTVVDASLVARIQELVEQTFYGWGGGGKLTVTRDRRNDLATYLRVEEVVHIQNAANFLNFKRRRDVVAREFMALPATERRSDWEVKTARVSLGGVCYHKDEPVNASINEYWLWHGTGEASAAGITDTDFDMSMVGKAAGSLFGRGLYFAESCMKADEYTYPDSRGWSPLLLCRVVLGRCYYCDAKKPWDIADVLESACRGGGFHAVVGDREKVRGTFREFVVFDNDQIYPEYIVWYSREPPILVPGKK